MTRIENSIEINAAPERVSQYLWDVNSLPNYLPMSDIEILEEGENVVTLRHKLIASGRTMDYVCEVKKFEKGRKITFKGTNSISVDGAWLLEPTEKGTKLTFIIEYQPPGWIFGKIIDKLKIEKEMKRIYTEGLEKLKQILEG